MRRTPTHDIAAVTALAVLLGAFVVAIACAAMLTPARAHDALPTAGQPNGWRYPAVCCNGGTEHGDCQLIKARTVKPETGGWRVTLRPGDHWMVTKPHSFFVSNERSRRSPDGEFHICLYPNEDNVQCFFAPPMGF